MAEVLRFRPEAVDWWLLLRDLPARLRRVQVLTPTSHPPDARLAMHQHGTVTLVAALRGTLRLEHPRLRVDLAEGDVALVLAGAWHHHAPLRAGAVAYGQGFLGGHSDWILHSRELELMAAVPVEPSRRLMDAAAGAADESDRRRHVVELLRTVVAERSEPVQAPHDALLAMELAMWRSLHRRDAVERMLAAGGLGRSRSYELFRRHRGAAPATVLRRARLQLARELLAGGLPVAEVASRCGFASRRAFTRCCTRLLGERPSRLRRL